MVSFLGHRLPLRHGRNALLYLAIWACSYGSARIGYYQHGITGVDVPLRSEGFQLQQADSEGIAFGIQELDEHSTSLRRTSPEQVGRLGSGTYLRNSEAP